MRTGKNTQDKASLGPALPQEEDYLDLLAGAAEEGKATEVESEEDREMLAELRRQEKQALVDRILKAKAKTQAAQAGGGGGGGGDGSSLGGGGGAGAMAPNKGQPSPYIQRKVR